jgi:hypothetical protein
LVDGPGRRWSALFSHGIKWTHLITKTTHSSSVGLLSKFEGVRVIANRPRYRSWIREVDEFFVYDLGQLSSTWWMIECRLSHHI